MCSFTHYFTLAGFVVRNNVARFIVYCKWFGRSLLLFSGALELVMHDCEPFFCVYVSFFFFVQSCFCSANFYATF